AGVEIRGSDLIRPIMQRQSVDAGRQGFGNMGAFTAICEHQVLRANPCSDLCAVDAESFNPFSQRGRRILERVSLAVQKAFVLVRLFAMTKGANLRGCSDSGHSAARLRPDLDPF